MFRIGNIHIIVEFMVYIIFQIFKVYYYQLKIRLWILKIHHVYQIEQVNIFILMIIFVIFDEDNGTSLKYNDISLKSSLTIFAGSLQPNRSYQFMVYMENRRNSSLQATGYVLVQVENTFPKMIAIG